MDDKLSFLDGDVPAETTVDAQTPPEVIEQPPEPQPVAEGPQRGPDGKFLPKETKDEAPAAPEPVAEVPPQPPAAPPEAAQPAPPAPAEPAKPPEGYVPVGVVQAMREELNQFKRQASQPPPEPPDPYEDFDGWKAHQEAQHAQTIVAERVHWSRQLAETKHGAELVGQAHQWAFERSEADPAFAQAAASSRDPYGFAIQEYQRHQALSLLSDPANFARFQAFLSGQAQEPAAAAAPAPPPPPAPVVAPPAKPTPPPQSIAATPNAGGSKPGEQPTGPGAAFDATFKD